MSKELIFTRYLYEKEEVEVALILSILQKKEEEALFWAYELYYSGFEFQLINLLWKIYFDFYALLNHGFQSYLLKKLDPSSGYIEEDPKILGSVIQNFVIRPFNIDVFMLRHIQNHFEMPTSIAKKEVDLKSLFEETREKESFDYEALLYFVFESDKPIILEDIIQCKKTVKEWKKIEKANLSININKKVLLLVYLLQHYGLKKNIKGGKNIYVYSDPSDFVMYETIEVDLSLKENKRIPKLPAYQILPIASIYSIQDDESEFLSLFDFQREKGERKQAYLNHWLYHASKSPLWKERIELYRGLIMEDEKKITFENDDLEEEFYQNYGYEPDEQKKEIQEKSIRKQDNKNINNNIKNCKCFYQTFSKNRFIIIEEEYLEQLDKFSIL
jgi:hypothetical protein